jgi:hypothetical protein
MDYVPTLAIGVTVITAVWSHAIWLSGRFASVQKVMDTKFEAILDKITEKLEYHERHDDRRFGEISNSLWEVRLQNAVSGRFYPDKKPKDSFPRTGGSQEGV